MHATKASLRAKGPAPLAAVLFATVTSGMAAGSWLAVAPDGTASVSAAAPQAPLVVVDRHDDTGLAITVDIAGIELAVEETKGGKFVTAALPETPVTGEIGEPALPVVRRLFIAPEGSTVDLKVCEGPASPIDLEAVGLVGLIVPMQAPILMVPGALEQAPFHYDEAAYSGGALRPSRRAVISELGIVRGNHLYLLEVRPVAYNPGRGLLMLWPHMRVTIDFRGARGGGGIPGPLAPLNGILLNPPHPTDPVGRGSGNYLIVVADAYASAITAFATAKESQGFVVNIHSVAPGTSNADIKTYITSLWLTPDAPEYILLVGDNDTIPHWIGGGDQTANTDLPYACMDPGDDWYPDIAIGRFSVRLVDELNNVVDKTLHVADGVFDDPRYARRAAFLAGTDVESGDEATHNWVIDTYMEPNGIESYKLYMRTYGATTEDVHIAFNTGCVYGVYYGHSWADQWKTGPPFSHGDVQSLENEGKYPFLFNFTCRIGDFAHATWEPCFLEEWLRVPNKGAAATYGASKFTYHADNPGWPETSNLEKYTFDSIYLDGIREVGPVWQAALLRLLAMYGPDNPVTRDYFEMFNLLGDPSLCIPDPPPANYLMIVPDDYANTAPVIQFTDAKTAMGFNVLMYRVSPDTSNAEIKSHIQDMWGTPTAPDYILLVGDTAGSVSTSNTIPHWVGEASKQADTDLPYACMDGPDDWYPDIAVGRFSVSSLDELQDVVDKTLFVEAGNFSDPDYVRRGAFIANPSTYNTAEPTHDWVIDNYFTPNDYEGIKVYSSEGADTADVTNAINDGCLFAVYLGHSTSSGWWDPAFDQDDVEALSNEGLYGLVFGWSCNTSHFSYPECFGETWLRQADKGAAAYISASDYIYWGSVEAWEPSAIHEKSFFAAFFEDEIWEVGRAWNAGLYRFLTEYGNWSGNPEDPPAENEDIIRNFFEEFVLLGDPALRLPQAAGFTLTPDPISQAVCCPPEDQAVYTVQVAQVGDFEELVTLEATGAPAGATVDFNVNSQQPPFTALMTIGNLIGTVPGDYDITISGTVLGEEQRSTVVTLNVSNAVPGTFSLLSPPNGDTDVARDPTFVWEPSSQAAQYDLELATDPGFSNVVYSTTVIGNTHALDFNLGSGTLYYWHVRAINGCGDSGFSSPFSFTTLDQGDYFTEEFPESAGDFDLDNFTVQFTPDGSGSYYDLCGWATTGLPTDPSGGTVLTLSDDGYSAATPTAAVSLYGTSYDTFYINANGTVTFLGGDSDWLESLEDHFGMARIAALYDDLSPSPSGTLSWKETAECVAVTWQNVPEYNTSNSNTFQIEMFWDGRIQITWLQIDSGDSIVGLSEGDGIPDDYLEMDLSEAGSCFAYGACCVGKTCSVGTEDECLAVEGDYRGDDTDCDPDPCIAYESDCVIISEVVNGYESGGCPTWIEITNTGFRNFAFFEGGVIVQTNTSNDVIVDVDLSGVVIPAGESFVVNSNQFGACTGAFPFIYGFEADFYTEAPFGDGNDRYIITDTSNGSHLLDIYGEFGLSGTGQPWEYTAGYAYRLPAYNSGKGQQFALNEWFCGGPGSLAGGNPTQLLLDNTSPGIHPFDDPCFTGERPCDMDGDEDIDVDDYNAFGACFTGPYIPYEPGCEPGDTDGDGDIDCDDWENFKLIWTGPPDIPPLFSDCDADCNHNGVADEFDITGGTSLDCNENAVPDECDIAEGTSSDLNENGIPDECEVCMPPMPEDGLGIACTYHNDCHGEARCVSGVCYVPKHRYLSIAAHPAQIPNTARRITLSGAGTLGWVGAPYENLGITLADVVASPVYARTDFAGDWPDVVHLTGCEIATGQTYFVQAILIGRNIASEGNYSEPLELHTPSVWGDTVSACVNDACLPPDGFVGLDDIMAAIKKYQKVDVAPVTWLDIDPSAGSQKPDQVIGIGDILSCTGGFQGKAYPGGGPLECP